MLTIGFDADDTLWHNESLYSSTQARFRELLTPYHEADWIDRTLYATEMRNLSHFGYGMKGFTLSMIETAIELTDGRITGNEIQTLLDLGKEMLAAPVELLPNVAEVVAELAETYPLVLITKGDLFDQEAKLARSGLGEHFRHVEIVSEKNAAAYSGVLGKYSIAPAHFAMVGNSLRSDILPVLEVGARAVHIPYAITWQHEYADVPQVDGFYALDSIADLPNLIAQW